MHSQEGCAHFAADAAIENPSRTRPALAFAGGPPLRFASADEAPVGAIYASRTTITSPAGRVPGWCTTRRALRRRDSSSKEDMGSWTQWLRQPQRVWLRRAAFQVHLWVGLGIGLYVV